MMVLSTPRTLGECLAWRWQLPLSTEQRPIVPAATVSSASSPAGDGRHGMPGSTSLTQAFRRFHSYVPFKQDAVLRLQVTSCFCEDAKGLPLLSSNGRAHPARRLSVCLAVRPSIRA